MYCERVTQISKLVGTDRDEEETFSVDAPAGPSATV